MATVGEFYQFLDEKAPFHTQMSFDNAGLLVGEREQEVSKLLISLDITEEVVEEALACGCQLIISHHPVIFHPLRALTEESPTGRILLKLARGHISAICAHTNLDLAAGGVNDALATTLGLTGVGPLCQDGVDSEGAPYGIGRVGMAAGEQSAAEFAASVKETLGANGVRYVDAGKTVRRVAVGGGACADLMERALAHACDTFVTADVKYNGFLDAKAMGINLIDAGHFPTENVVCPVLAHWLEETFSHVEILRSKVHHEVFSYL